MMIKCEVIKEFTLEKFNELVDIKRKSIDIKGKLFVGDTFECNEDMVKYLTGNNEQGKTVVKVIEVEPEIKIEKNKIELNANNITVTDKDNKKINIKNKKSSKK